MYCTSRFQLLDIILAASSEPLRHANADGPSMNGLEPITHTSTLVAGYTQAEEKQSRPQGGFPTVMEETRWNWLAWERSSGK